MIPSIHKLTWKEINYMLRKWRRIHGKVFSFLLIDQYKNKSYDKRWVHISIKISKKATFRNAIKRQVYRTVSWLSSTWRHYKIFIYINKKSLPTILSSLESLTKTDIIKYRNKHIYTDLKLLPIQWTKTHYEKQKLPSKSR